MMNRRSFFKQIHMILPLALILVLISSPSGGQTNYSMNVVTPGYIQANTELPLRGDDRFLEVALPFPFTFYETVYNRAYVSTNGYLNFIAGNTAYANATLPTAAAPNGAIYAFWDDLYVDLSASVRTELLGTAPHRQFVIEWRNVTFYSNTFRRLDFEIVLHEDGMILLQYRNTENEGRERGNSATIGVENQLGNLAMQFSWNAPSLELGDFAIQFAHGPKEVPVDIKPMGCPNPFNAGSKGVLPVAILGTADLDVSTIDPATVTLAGVTPLRSTLEDVATPYEPYVDKIDPNQCNSLGPDGYQDLLFKFDSQEVAATLADVNNREAVTLELRGQLLDGTEIKGEDVMIVIKKGKINKHNKNKKEKKK
jgi:hypothetical protein